MKDEKVCVAGATGYLGSRVVAELRARGAEVTAIVRDRSREADVRRLTGLGATVAYIDASQVGARFADALTGASAAISCMAAGYVKVDARSDLWAIDRDATIRFGLEAVRAGVQHLILVATFEGRASRAVTGLSEAKEAAVDALTEACRAAGVAFTVVRPNAYFKDLTDRAFDTVSRRGEHAVIGDGSRRINPIHGDDVAAFIADCLTDPGRAGREHLVGGPDIFTYREIGELAAEVLGKQGSLRIRSISVAWLRVAAALASAAGVVSRASRRRAAILRWMIYAGTHDAVAPVCGARRLRDEFLRKREAATPVASKV